MRCFICALIFCGFAAAAAGQTKSYKLDDAELKAEISRQIVESIRDRQFPGAQVIVIRDNRLILDSCYGYTDYTFRTKTTRNTLYDLASLTKCMATTLGMMYLQEKGKIDVQQPLRTYLARYDTIGFGGLPLTRFLTHTTGFTSTLGLQYKLVSAQGEQADTNNWFKGILSTKSNENYPYYFGKSGKDKLYVHKDLKKSDFVSPVKDNRHNVKITASLYIDPEFYRQVVDSLIIASYRYKDFKTRYSDINFQLMRQVIEQVAGTRIDSFLTANIYRPMGLKNICYLPIEQGFAPEEIAPTEYDYILRNETVRGYVHDESAAIMGNVEGNAGLFGTAQSLLPICQELLNPGNGFFKAETKNLFLKQPYLKENNYRALGFQRQKDGYSLKSSSFGHSGFTGTFFQIDRTTGTIFIFLSNMINPSRSFMDSADERLYYHLWRTINERE